MTKTWLITGASSGLGRIMTESLLARGDRVIATVRRADALRDLTERHGERLVVRILDVVDAEAVRRTIGEAFARAGASTSSSATRPTACSARPRS